MSVGERIRYMRLVVFFDLPVDTPAQRKDYRVFRKFLLKDGYLMLQESVYASLLLTMGRREARCKDSGNIARQLALYRFCA